MLLGEQDEDRELTIYFSEIQSLVVIISGGVIGVSFI